MQGISNVLPDLFREDTGLGGVDLMAQGALVYVRAHGADDDPWVQVEATPAIRAYIHHTRVLYDECQPELTHWFRESQGLAYLQPAIDDGCLLQARRCPVCDGWQPDRPALARHLRFVHGVRPCESEEPADADVDVEDVVICPCGSVHRRWGAE